MNRTRGCMVGWPEVQKKFYHTVIEYRYDKVFLPLYQKIIGRKKGCEAEEV